MGIFRRRAKTEERAEGFVDAEEQLLRAMLSTDVVTREMALQVPTIAGGIDLIAGLIASTPIKLFTERNGETEEITGDPRTFLLNDETGDVMNANEFWKAITRDYFLGKGGYAYIERSRNRFTGLYYVEDKYVSFLKGCDPIHKDFRILVNGVQYYPHEFLKILRNTKDGAEGIPITQEHSKMIEAAYAEVVFERNIVKRGGGKRGFLSSEKKLDPEALKKLKSSFARMYNNSNDASENFVVLNSGVAFKEAEKTSVEMQLNENKQVNATEFAKIFHITPEIISGKANQDDIASLARLAAIPLMVTIQCALNEGFLLESEKGVKYWAFDTKELLKGDMKTRFEAYRQAVDGGFMQPDEIRYIEDMKPIGLKWIRLGLDDVLYDPETERIFTPNTNKMTHMREAALQPAGTDAIMNEERARQWTKGAKGLFTGSKRVEDGASVGGSGGAGGSGSAAGNSDGENNGLTSTKESGKIQSSSNAVSALGVNKFEVGFTEKNLDRHWSGGERDHSTQYPKYTKKQYAERAQTLVQSAVDDQKVLGYATQKGAVIRYDTETNDFVKGYPKTGIATMFKPAREKQYFEDQKKKEGV